MANGCDLNVDKIYALFGVNRFWSEIMVVLSFGHLEGVTLITCVALKGAELYQIQCRVIFCGLLANTNTWALMTRRDLQNLLKITLHGIFHCLAPKRATKFPKMPLWRKCFFSEKNTCVRARWRWSSNLGCVTLFEYWKQAFPPFLI